jgi:hypothetical protein
MQKNNPGNNSGAAQKPLFICLHHLVTSAAATVAALVIAVVKPFVQAPDFLAALLLQVLDNTFLPEPVHEEIIAHPPYPVVILAVYLCNFYIQFMPGEIVTAPAAVIAAVAAFVITRIIPVAVVISLVFVICLRHRRQRH